MVMRLCSDVGEDGLDMPSEAVLPLRAQVL